MDLVSLFSSHLRQLSVKKFTELFAIIIVIKEERCQAGKVKGQTLSLQYESFYGEKGP